MTTDYYPDNFELSKVKRPGSANSCCSTILFVNFFFCTANCTGRDFRVRNFLITRKIDIENTTKMGTFNTKNV